MCVGRGRGMGGRGEAYMCKFSINNVICVQIYQFMNETTMESFRLTKLIILII